jgi:hypothetical protein
MNFIENNQQIKILFFHNVLKIDGGSPGGKLAMKDQKSNIAIFDTFKTSRHKFTGEAKRQRGIIAHLATEQSPELRTRTSIAHAIAKKHGILWQNIYSGIFRDLDEVLIPAGVVREGGRLPLRRGPKALQLEGVPFYELTAGGLLVAAAIEEVGEKRMKMLEECISSIPTSDQNDRTLREGILLLVRIAPQFVSKIINEYIYAYSTGLINSIAPIDYSKMRSVISSRVAVEKELVEAFIGLQSDKERDLVRNFFKVVT